VGEDHGRADLQRSGGPDGGTTITGVASRVQREYGERCLCAKRSNDSGTTTFANTVGAGTALASVTTAWPARRRSTAAPSPRMELRPTTIRCTRAGTTLARPAPGCDPAQQHGEWRGLTLAVNTGATDVRRRGGWHDAADLAHHGRDGHSSSWREHERYDHVQPTTRRFQGTYSDAGLLGGGHDRTLARCARPSTRAAAGRSPSPAR